MINDHKIPHLRYDSRDNHANKDGIKHRPLQQKGEINIQIKHQGRMLSLSPTGNCTNKQTNKDVDDHADNDDNRLNAMRKKTDQDQLQRGAASSSASRDVDVGAVTVKTLLSSG